MKITNFDIFCAQLTSALAQPLPGEAAQYQFAPEFRKKLPNNDAYFEQMQAKPAAVLVLMYPINSVVHLLFTQRTAQLAAHSNQISFVGGRVDATDVDFVHTALREAHEEAGINPKQVQVLGALTKTYIPPSNYLVHPIVAACGGQPTFAPQATEVAAIIEIPLEIFIKNDYIQQITTPQGWQVPAFAYNNIEIWGATAIILSELRSLITQINAEIH
jgi:8-oxo-dGTP pyrophosphatase MutT (NUDIX family)